MKSLYKILLGWISLFIITGCSTDKLDLYPETQLTEGNFYTSEADFVQATNDIYRQLGRIYTGGGLPDLFGELFSDNVYVKFSSGANAFPEEINKHRILTNNGRIQEAWETAYNAIYVCNNIIKQLDETSVVFAEPTTKDQLKAQTLVVRALIYYNLVQAFGAVPFPLTVVTPDESYAYLRENTEVILTQLTSDLSFAKDKLPESYSGVDVGRLTSYAASAMLAKVYLLDGKQSDAVQELQRIVTSGKYSLDANNDGRIDQADYAFLFAANTKNSKESILEVQYLAGQNQVNSNHQAYYAPYYFSFHLPNSTETFRGEGMNTPADDLIDEYEDNDPRKNLSLQLGYTDLQSNQFVDYPYTIKFYDPNWRYPGQNVEIIRYADILLLLAEVTGDVAYLNQVRERVGLPRFGENGYPTKYGSLALAIEHERRIELAFEFHRFFDLVRTGRAVEVFKSKGLYIAENQLVFPIPQHAIDVNPGLTQNDY